MECQSLCRALILSYGDSQGRRGLAQRISQVSEPLHGMVLRAATLILIDRCLGLTSLINHCRRPLTLDRTRPYLYLDRPVAGVEPHALPQRVEGHHGCQAEDPLSQHVL